MEGQKEKRKSTRVIEKKEESLKVERKPKVEKFEVESIVGKKYMEGKILYRVKWARYGEKSNSWEPITNLGGCNNAISAFERSKEAGDFNRTPLYLQGFEVERMSDPSFLPGKYKFFLVTYKDTDPPHLTEVWPVKLALRIAPQLTLTTMCNFYRKSQELNAMIAKEEARIAAIEYPPDMRRLCEVYNIDPNKVWPKSDEEDKEEEQPGPSTSTNPVAKKKKKTYYRASGSRRRTKKRVAAKTAEPAAGASEEPGTSKEGEEQRPEPEDETESREKDEKDSGEDGK